MNICILGTGYVGLVSGVCLAANGHVVTSVDLQADVVDRLNRMQPHIHEQGLPEMLRRVGTEKRFRATLLLDDGLADADLVVIAVGTPTTEGRIDLRYIREAAGQIGTWLKRSSRFLSIVIKSTVLPGTTDTFVRSILEQTSGKRLGAFGLGMNPEFLREGNAIEDFTKPDRIVLGHEDARTLSLLQEVYQPWSCEKLAVNTRTAEMIKYANNCLLATQISAVNELANLCFEVGGIDAQQVMTGVHLDKRWNPVLAGQRVNPSILTYLVPGCGFGGSCFPKDVQALCTMGQEHRIEMSMLQAVLTVNERQPRQVLRLLEKHFGSLEGRKILVLGMAFKPDTDDVRESAALKIVRDLAQARSTIIAHDPIALDNARKALEDVTVSWVSDWRQALTEIDAVVIATKWVEYTALAQPEHTAHLQGKVVVDPRRLFQPKDFPQAVYFSIGRRPIS